MNNKNAAFFVRGMLALLLSTLVWVWLNLVGSFIRLYDLRSSKVLLESVGPLKLSTAAFLILVVPTLVVSFLVHRRLSAGMRLVFYAVLGSLYSVSYFVVTWKLAAFDALVWDFSAIGGVAGLTYGTILDFPWQLRASSGDGDEAAVSDVRRKLLGSLGLFAGTTGLFGALAGPFYFWKNRNTHIDVNVSRLDEGQLMRVEVGNSPVWILKRSPDVIRLLEQENQRLLDPRSEFSRQPEQARNRLRSIRPEYLVVYGICTHLGCSPVYRSQCSVSATPCPSPDPHFFCPCHGGVFDLAGRVYKDTPPPKNMAIPVHEFVSEGVIRLHFPTVAQAWHA